MADIQSVENQANYPAANGQKLPFGKFDFDHIPEARISQTKLVLRSYLPCEQMYIAMTK